MPRVKNQYGEFETDKELGRHVDWKPEYNQKIIEYFDVSPTREVEVTKTDKKGNEYTTFEEKANPMPTLEGFAAKIGVNGDTIVQWVKNTKKCPGFAAAYEKARHLQHDILVTNGLLGHYSTQFAIFIAKNVTNLRDQQSVDLTSQGKELKAAVINIVKPDEGDNLQT